MNPSRIHDPAGPDPRQPLDPGQAHDLGVEHLGPAADAASDGLGTLRERLAPHLEGYRLEGCLGRGGMGAVFLAHQERLDRKVAVKVLIPPDTGDETWTERFQREARALARLSHPSIVAVHDFGQEDDLAWIVMEYVEGASLRSLLSGKRLTPPEALAIVPQICSALQFAHERGVVHRDIKPENILLDVDGNVKIADFGLAKLTDAIAPGVELTGTHQAMGTPRYMAPEQLERPRSVDHRADIFALGVVFYEMLTGQVPAGRVEAPSRQVHIDVRLDEIVLRALEREPEKRYQSAGEVRDRLAEVERSPAAAAVHRAAAAPGEPSLRSARNGEPARRSIETYDPAPLLEATRAPLAWIDRAVALVTLGALLAPNTVTHWSSLDSDDSPLVRPTRLLAGDPLALVALAILSLPLLAQLAPALRHRPMSASWLRIVAGLLGLGFIPGWVMMRNEGHGRTQLTDVGDACMVAMAAAGIVLVLAACVTLIPVFVPRLARRRVDVPLAVRERLRWVATVLCILGLITLALPWHARAGTQPGWESPFGVIAAVAFGLALIVRWSVPLGVTPWPAGVVMLAAAIATFTVGFGPLAEGGDPAVAPSGPILAVCMGVALGIMGLVEMAIRNGPSGASRKSSP